MRPQTVDDFGGEVRMSGSQLNVRHCPECGSDAWKVYCSLDSGAWLCFRCESHGRVSVGRDAGAIRARLAAPSGRARWGPAEMPENHSLGSEAVRFMWARYGISLEMSRNFMLVQGSGAPERAYGDRILIPYCDRAGEVVYYSGRSFRGQEPKYLNMPGRHPLYVPDWIRGPGFPAGCDVVLVEGAFDAMKVWLAGCATVIGLGGKQLARYLLPELLALRPRRVLVMLDSDALGAALRLRHQLEPYVDGVDVANLPEGKDPAGMEVDDIKRLIERSIP